MSKFTVPGIVVVFDTCGFETDPSAEAS